CRCDRTRLCCPDVMRSPSQFRVNEPQAGREAEGSMEGCPYTPRCGERRVGAAFHAALLRKDLIGVTGYPAGIEASCAPDNYPLSPIETHGAALTLQLHPTRLALGGFWDGAVEHRHRIRSPV